MKKELIIEKAIAIFILVAILFFMVLCIMKIHRVGNLCGWYDWRTIMWCTTIPLSIWVGTLWGKLLFRKK